MDLRSEIDRARNDAAELERLYRTALHLHTDQAFAEVIRELRAERPDDVLMEAWAVRLEPTSPGVAEGARPERHWGLVVGLGVLLGLATAFLAGGKPPVPIPGEANGIYWLAWGPLMTLGILAYFARVPGAGLPPTRYIASAAGTILVAIFLGLTMGGESGEVAAMGSLHLLFVCWTAVGAALCLGTADPARQAYAYLAKSVEILLTGGIFFAAGLVFIGLTVGIFSVLGITLSEEYLVVVAAWGVGAIPLLAIGSAFDATRTPIDQDWQAGLSRTLRIIARLLLPLALGVMLVYVVFFIPVYFTKPFEEREVLIVYNATILAVMVLLTVAVSGPTPAGSDVQRRLFRGAVLALWGLTLILNVYALVAVSWRTADSGLTPNRFIVIGWNVTTLLILGSVSFRLWKDRAESWVTVFRDSIGRFAPVAAVWVLVLLLVLPFLG